MKIKSNFIIVGYICDKPIESISADKNLNTQIPALKLHLQFFKIIYIFDKTIGINIDII